MSEIPPEVMDLVNAAVREAEPRIRRSERERIAIWLEEQGKVARYAPHGVHPAAATRTQAAILGWASVQILTDQLTPGPAQPPREEGAEPGAPG